jgi:hypothetical protein
MADLEIIHPSNMRLIVVILLYFYFRPLLVEVEKC